MARVTYVVWRCQQLDPQPLCDVCKRIILRLFGPRQVAKRFHHAATHYSQLHDATAVVLYAKNLHDIDAFELASTTRMISREITNR